LRPGYWPSYFFRLCIFLSFINTIRCILYSLDKVSVFQILTEIAFALVLVKAVLSGKISIAGKKKYLMPITAFFLVLGAVSVFSANPDQSFWGSYVRRQGFFAYLHYFAFLLVLLSCLNDKKRIGRIITALSTSSSIIAVYGIFQWLGIDPIAWQKSYLFGRVISTINDGAAGFFGELFAVNRVFGRV